MVRLVGTLDRDTEVVGLFLRQHGQLDAELFEVQSGHLFVELLGQHVDLGLVGIGVAIVPELQLCQHLVRERSAHHEAGMTGGTAQIHKPSLGQDDHTATGILERIAIDRTDVGCLDFILGRGTRRRLASPARRRRSRYRSDQCCKESHHSAFL